MNDKLKKVHVRKPTSAIPVIHERSAFWAFIAREKNRADRNRSVFALVAFNLSNRGEVSRPCEEFLRTVVQEMRSVDIIGWLNDEWIAVLLPSTSPVGGEQFARRIDACEPVHSPHNPAIYSYPDKWHLEEPERKPVLPTSESSTSRRAGLFLWVVALVLAGSVISGCANGSTIPNPSESTAIVTFGASTLVAGALIFDSPEVAIQKGQTFELSTSNATLRSAPGWEWFVNNDRDLTQTTAIFRWDTTDILPGQYLVGAVVVCGGVKLSGSIRVTVTAGGGS